MTVAKQCGFILTILHCMPKVKRLDPRGRQHLRVHYSWVNRMVRCFEELTFSRAEVRFHPRHRIMRKHYSL